MAELLAQTKVTPTIESTRSSPLLQRCGDHPCPPTGCTGAKDEHSLQRHASGPGPAGVPPVVHAVVRTPGTALEPALREPFEARFGQDFTGVRVHTDPPAAASAHAVHAHAYTVGQHVVFGSGKYRPHTRPGQRLLAHELVHVVQQRDAGGDLPRPMSISRSHGADEREADTIADRVLSGHDGRPAPAGRRSHRLRVHPSPADVARSR